MFNLAWNCHWKRVLCLFLAAPSNYTKLNRNVHKNTRTVAWQSIQTSSSHHSQSDCNHQDGRNMAQLCLRNTVRHFSFHLKSDILIDLNRINEPCAATTKHLQASCNQLQLLIPPGLLRLAWTVAKLQFLFECQISSASEISDHLQPEPKRWFLLLSFFSHCSYDHHHTKIK